MFSDQPSQDSAERTKAVSVTRAYYDAPIPSFLKTDADSIVGRLATWHSQDLVIQQTYAWRAQVRLLHRELANFDHGQVYFEFKIPRFGKRADVVIYLNGVVFVLEFKIGSS